MTLQHYLWEQIKFRDKLREDKNISPTAQRNKNSVKSIFKHTHSKEEINIDDHLSTVPCKISV